MDSVFSPADLLAAFAATTTDAPLGPDRHGAAIALVFCHSGEALCVCLGRRALNPLDPWSGDLAFPGGKFGSDDASLHAAAARETREEVGLTLPTTALIGRMPPIFARGGSRRSLPVWPLIYHLETPPPPFLLNTEMSAAHWIPVADLWHRCQWVPFSSPATRTQRWGILVADHFLWGFSLQVLVALGEVLGYPLKNTGIPAAQHAARTSG